MLLIDASYIKPKKSIKKISRVSALHYYAKQCQKTQIKEPTYWESILKISLDKLNIDYKFQYYVVIGSETYYILDFYFPECKVAIELDGYYHFTKKGKARDVKRDKMLKSNKGITVYRYTNKQLTDNINFVIQDIINKITK